MLVFSRSGSYSFYTSNGPGYQGVTRNHVEPSTLNIYNTSSVYCRELAPGTVSLTGDWTHGDDSKQCRNYSHSYFG